MQYDLNAALAQAEKEFNIGAGDDSFKFAEGDNRVRVMSEFEVLQTVNKFEKDPAKKANLRTRFLFWVYDYTSKQVKLAFWPKTIVTAMGALAANPEYASTEVPMPYDLIINAKNAGTIDVEYQVVAARTNTPVPPEALDQLADTKKFKPIREVRDLILNKETAPVASQSDTEVITEDLPE